MRFRLEIFETGKLSDWKTFGLEILKLMTGKHLDWITVGQEILKLENVKTGKN